MIRLFNVYYPIRTVILLAPRGSYGALGPATYGPDVWAGRTLEFQTTVTAKGATLTLRYAISVR